MKSIAWDGYLFSQPDSAFYFAGLQYKLAESVSNKKWMADALNTQGTSFYIRQDYDKTIDYYTKSLIIAEEDGNKRRIAGCLNNIGAVYNLLGNDAKAMEYYTRGLKIAEEIGNKKFIGNTLLNIGMIYHDKGDLAKALDYYIKSLKIAEEVGNKKGIADILSSIGIVNNDLGNYDKAIKYYSRSLEIYELLEQYDGISKTLINLGSIYFDQGDDEKAIKHYSRSIKISEKLGDKFITSSCINNIGNIYKNQGNYVKALEYYNKSIKIKEEIGDKNGISISLNSFGYIYYLQGYYTKALEKCTNALSIAKEIGRVEAIRNSSKYLWEINKKLGKNNQALEMYELYIEMRDSILRIENKEAMIQKEFKYEYEKQAIADSIAHADEILIQQAENLAKEEQLKSEKQRRTGLLVIVGLVLVSLGFVFVQLRKTRAQKVVIEGQHQKLNETHDKLNESHQEITDSINYAKRIQDALMTSIVYMKDVIPESFIFFQPKDVVSGDFYWVYRSPKGQIYFTVADCTGHGVPGAFMSMIGTSLLNEFIIENNLEDTAEILTNMRKQIIKSLKQEGADADNKDGMDMALCKYDPKKKTVQYSGAYNPLIHISKNEINHIKGDNQPIGLHTGRKLPFTNHEIKVKKGDMLYIYSDGFADQFGGERGKKYMSGNFKKFLLSISEMKTEEQDKLIKEEFTNWMGENEQIDDVCVMGVKV